MVESTGNVKRPGDRNAAVVSFRQPAECGDVVLRLGSLRRA
jgi:hypothetical protein